MLLKLLIWFLCFWKKTQTLPPQPSTAALNAQGYLENHSKRDVCPSLLTEDVGLIYTKDLNFFTRRRKSKESVTFLWMLSVRHTELLMLHLWYQFVERLGLFETPSPLQEAILLKTDHFGSAGRESGPELESVLSEASDRTSRWTH